MQIRLTFRSECRNLFIRGDAARHRREGEQTIIAVFYRPAGAGGALSLFRERRFFVFPPTKPIHRFSS